MLENLSDNFPQRQKELRCYVDRRKQMHIHTSWKSYFGTIIFSEEFYKLLVKGPNKCCNKIRPMLTSFLIVYALTPMLLNSIIFTDIGQFPSSKNFNSIEPQFFKAYNVSGMGLMAYTR